MNTLIRNLALTLTLACLGCNARPLTQLIVVTEASLQVPSELDQVEITITSPSGVMGHRMMAIRSTADLPVTLGVVHRGGPLGPIHITVRGRLGEVEIVTREAEVTLQEGRTLRLDLPLDVRCRGVMCRGDQTCAGGECRALAIAADELTVFDGTLPSASDAGNADAGNADAGNADAGNADAGNADAGSPDAGNADAGSPDAYSMPTCTPACTNPPEASAECVLGECRLTCGRDRGDCNGVYADGCEVDTRDNDSHCGVCGNRCDADERCRGRECRD